MLGKKKKTEAELRRSVDKGLNDLLANYDKMTPREQQELKAMIAAASIAGSSLKAAEILKKAEAFGDKLNDKTMDMIEAARKQAQKSPQPAHIDPQKLIEASERLQKLIEKENREREERLKKLDETAAKLKAASDRLVGEAEKAAAERKEKATEVAREKEKEAAWRKDGCPVTKPVTVGKPLKLKPRKPGT